MPDTAVARDTGLTLAVGAAGAALAWAVGAPAPFLTGPALVVSLATLAGLRGTIPVPLRDLIFILIGLGLGSGVTPEILDEARRWPISLVLMGLSIAAILVLGAVLLRRIFAMDRRSAVLAAAPGHLSFVLSLSLDSGTDTRRIAVIQSLRVLMLTLLVPAAVALFSDADMAGIRPAGTTVAPLHLTGLAVLAAALGLVFKRIRLPAAFLLAGMAVSSVGHGTGWTPGVVPGWLSTAAFITMGTLIGTRFTGVTPGLLGASLLGSVLLTAMALAVASLGAWLAHLATGLRLLDLVIAFAPGGLETMIAMASVLGADPALVALHHVARLFLLTALIPIALSRAKAA